MQSQKWIAHFKAQYGNFIRSKIQVLTELCTTKAVMSVLTKVKMSVPNKYFKGRGCNFGDHDEYKRSKPPTCHEASDGKKDQRARKKHPWR